MHKEGYYSSGEFAKIAHVSVRTIRFYDQKNLLKPSYVSDTGARFYTEQDLVTLQQILLLKYLGFSLEDIRQISLEPSDSYMLRNALALQKKLIQERIEEMQLVKLSIDSTINALDKGNAPDWTNMLELIHLTAMENSLKNQYQNASNISARIRLHSDYSVNKQGWFPWIYEKCEIRSGMRILEIGCGNGALWIEALGQTEHKNVKEIQIILSDISEGILHDARRDIENELTKLNRSLNKTNKCCPFSFEYNSFDCHSIPYDADSFDLVIANHVLFYCKDIDIVCAEVSRVLKTDGRFICSTYGSHHMQEIRQLAEGFDDRIKLSQNNLYEIFGLENGFSILNNHFESVTLEKYEDEILLNSANPLIEYILSCHGNQGQYLLDKYSEFRSYIEKKTSKEFHITKDAGIFICRRPV